MVPHVSVSRTENAFTNTPSREPAALRLRRALHLPLCHAARERRNSGFRRGGHPGDEGGFRTTRAGGIAAARPGGVVRPELRRGHVAGNPPGKSGTRENDKLGTTARRG